MALINNPSGAPLRPEGKIAMDPMQIPSFRACYAVQQGIDRNLLFYVVGGLGDAICAEPTIRWAKKRFVDSKITIATWWPEVFRHLVSDENIINFRLDPTPEEAYHKTHYVIRTLYPGDRLHDEFIPHHFQNVIDYHSISMFRITLDPSEKQICLTYSKGDRNNYDSAVLYKKPSIVVHPGRTWPSRTIPADYWNSILRILIAHGFEPVLIGGAQEAATGTVEVNTAGCLDLRGKLSVGSSIALLKDCEVLLTNDSSPIHMAASGCAWIGMLSTVKRPDLISHWRGPESEFGWKMQNLTSGGLWEKFTHHPCDNESIDFSKNNPSEYLKDHEKVAFWAMSKTARGFSL